MTQEKKSSIFDLTLKEILINWSVTSQITLNDLLRLIKKMNTEKTLNKYKTWKEYIIEFGKEFITILSKEDRILYSGITILMISVFLYVIDAST